MVNLYAKYKNVKQRAKSAKKLDMFKKLHYFCTTKPITLREWRGNLKKPIIMTKAEIVNEVAKATGIEKVTVQTVVESFMESVKSSVEKGEPVYLRGFGSFIVKHRAQKAARNITRNTTITIPAHDIPAFKPAKVFVNALKK